MKITLEKDDQPFIKTTAPVKRVSKDTENSHELLPRLNTSFEIPMKEYIKLASSLSKIMAINLALKMHIFDLIDLKGNDFIDIPTIKQELQIQIHSRQLMAILNKLVAHGFLLRDDTAKYKNTDYTMKYFVSSSEENYIGVYQIADFYMQRFSECEENVISGKTSNELNEMNSNQELARNFSDLFYTTNQDTFTALVDSFNFGKYKKVIDINGKNGDLSAKIKNSFPKVEVTSMDHHIFQDFALTHMKRQNMEDKVNLKFWDPFKEKIPESDVVIATHLLQYFFEEGKVKILKEIYDSLPSGGMLIIIENCVFESKKYEPEADIISFFFTIDCVEGYTMTVKEWEKLLGDCGYKGIEHKKMKNAADFIFALK